MRELKGQEIIKGYSAFIVLRLIKERPSSAYGLMKSINEKSSGLFDLKAPSMVELLETLAEDNLVEFTLGKNDRNVPKKIYGITGEGLSF